MTSLKDSLIENELVKDIQVEYKHYYSQKRSKEENPIIINPFVNNIKKLKEQNDKKNKEMSDKKNDISNLTEEMKFKKKSKVFKDGLINLESNPKTGLFSNLLNKVKKPLKFSNLNENTKEKDKVSKIATEQFPSIKPEEKSKENKLDEQKKKMDNSSFNSSEYNFIDSKRKGKDDSSDNQKKVEDQMKISIETYKSVEPEEDLCDSKEKEDKNESFNLDSVEKYEKKSEKSDNENKFKMATEKNLENFSKEKIIKSEKYSSYNFEENQIDDFEESVHESEAKKTSNKKQFFDTGFKSEKVMNLKIDYDEMDIESQKTIKQMDDKSIQKNLKISNDFQLYTIGDNNNYNFPSKKYEPYITNINLKNTDQNHEFRPTTNRKIKRVYVENKIFERQVETVRPQQREFIPPPHKIIRLDGTVEDCVYYQEDLDMLEQYHSHGNNNVYYNQEETGLVYSTRPANYQSTSPTLQYEEAVIRPTVKRIEIHEDVKYSEPQINNHRYNDREKIASSKLIHRSKSPNYHGKIVKKSIIRSVSPYKIVENKSARIIRKKPFKTSIYDQQWKTNTRIINHTKSTFQPIKVSKIIEAPKQATVTKEDDLFSMMRTFLKNANSTQNEIKVLTENVETLRQEFMNFKVKVKLDSKRISSVMENSKNSSLCLENSSMQKLKKQVHETDHDLKKNNLMINQLKQNND